MVERVQCISNRNKKYFSQNIYWGYGYFNCFSYHLLLSGLNVCRSGGSPSAGGTNGRDPLGGILEVGLELMAVQQPLQPALLLWAGAGIST